jgi:hypothetical protein
VRDRTQQEIEEMETALDLQRDEQEKKDAASMPEVRKTDTAALHEVPDMQDEVEFFSRGEEEALSAEADYWEGKLRGDA